MGFEDFVLAHAVWVVVAAKTDNDEALFFREDGLVDVPAGAEVGDDDGTHGAICVERLLGRGCLQIVVCT